MARPGVLRFALPAVLAALCVATVGASPPAPQSTNPRVMKSAVARLLEQRVARLPASRRFDAAPVQEGPGQGDTVAPPTQSQPETVAPTQTATPRPQAEEVQLVRPDRALEAQIDRALVSQAPLQRVIANGGEVLPLPGVIRQLDESGRVTQLKAYVLAGRSLAYDATRNLFAGSIYVGVSDIAPSPPRSLGTPIRFAVLNAEASEPSAVQIERTSTPIEIAIHLIAAPGGGATIRIASDLTPEGMPVNVPLRPVLSIEPGSTSIEGWGLAVTDLNISVVGLEQPAGRTVFLRSSSGYLTPSRVQLDAQGNAMATIRSDRIGAAHIYATTPGLARTDTAVDFRFPYLTILASLLGGIVGGLVRLLGANQTSSLLRALGAAVGCGVLVFALYAVGVNVLPVSPSVTVGAVLVFAVSGLGAYIGTRLLDRLLTPPPAA